MKQQYYLTVDAMSAFKKGFRYAKGGEKVTEVSVNHDAVIVERADGERFPVHKSKLTPITNTK